MISEGIPNRLPPEELDQYNAKLRLERSLAQLAHVRRLLDSSSQKSVKVIVTIPTDTKDVNVQSSVDVNASMLRGLTTAVMGARDDLAKIDPELAEEIAPSKDGTGLPVADTIFESPKPTFSDQVKEHIAQNGDY